MKLRKYPKGLKSQVKRLEAKYAKKQKVKQRLKDIDDLKKKRDDLLKKLK